MMKHGTCGRNYEIGVDWLFQGHLKATLVSDFKPKTNKKTINTWGNT
jgi:hypothetical protein